AFVTKKRRTTVQLAKNLQLLQYFQYFWFYCPISREVELLQLNLPFVGLQIKQVDLQSFQHLQRVGFVCSGFEDFEWYRLGVQYDDINEPNHIGRSIAANTF